MSWIFRLALFLLLALLAALLGYYLRLDAGMVYLRFQGWEVETTVVLLGLAVCLGRRSPSPFTRWQCAGRAVSAGARARTRHGAPGPGPGVGLRGQSVARHQRALLEAGAKPLQRLSALLSAAEVAHLRGETGLVDEILRSAVELERGKHVAPLRSADAWRAERGDEADITAIVKRSEASNAPPRVLRTLIEGLLTRGRAAEALAPLQRLAERRQIGDRELAALELRVLSQALEQAPGPAPRWTACGQRLASRNAASGWCWQP